MIGVTLVLVGLEIQKNDTIVVIWRDTSAGGVKILTCVLSDYGSKGLLAELE